MPHARIMHALSTPCLNSHSLEQSFSLFTSPSVGADDLPSLSLYISLALTRTVALLHCLALSRSHMITIRSRFPPLSISHTISLYCTLPLHHTALWLSLGLTRSCIGNRKSPLTIPRDPKACRSLQCGAVRLLHPRASYGTLRVPQVP